MPFDVTRKIDFLIVRHAVHNLLETVLKLLLIVQAEREFRRAVIV